MTVAGTDKPAQAGAVRTEDNRHVAGKVDCADGVGIVVNIGRMQAGLAAVCPGPFRFRSNQAHAGAAGVVMHLPGSGKESVDILWREKIGCTMWPVHHMQCPVLAVLRTLVSRQ